MEQTFLFIIMSFALKLSYFEYAMSNGLDFMQSMCFS